MSHSKCPIVKIASGTKSTAICIELIKGLKYKAQTP